MAEYNLLTQELLTQGYTAENYPDYVKIASGVLDAKNPLHNIYGGFNYTQEYRRKMVFKTGCGLMVMGGYFTGSMWYKGIEWLPENNNPVITCPYRKPKCDLRSPLLNDGTVDGCIRKISQCDCHKTDEPYDYEHSLDKARDEEFAERKRKYDEFSEKKKGHVCYWHMVYDELTEEWIQVYDPMICARMCTNTGGVCSLSNKPVSKKRGNVFYDVKLSWIRRDGTLFDGERITKINKGVRLFKKNVSLTICEQVAKRCKKEILDKEKIKRNIDTFLYGYEVDVVNIRAEQRESRDLEQDLKDLADGFEVTHASDEIKRKKEEKHEKRVKAQENKIAKLEKKLIDVGYYNLEEYSLDRIHADKWLCEKRIAELEKIRRQREKEEQEQPVQMSIFDFLEETCNH